jgi:hypothetical protein
MPSRSASSRAIKSAPHAAEQTNASARSAASMSTSRCQTIGTFSSGKRGGSVSGASICRPVSAITAGGLVHFHHFSGSVALCVETVTKPGRESCGSEPWPPQIRRFNELFVDSWMGCFSQDPRKVRQSRQIEARSTRSSPPCCTNATHGHLHLDRRVVQSPPMALRLRISAPQSTTRGKNEAAE